MAPTRVQMPVSGRGVVWVPVLGLLTLLCMPYAMAACPNGVASGCCGAYCSTSCSSGSCLVQRNGCSNICKKCEVSTCQTSCPANYFLQPDTANVCYAQNSGCMKCTPCSSAPGVPSPCNARPATCRPGTKAVVIWTGPSGCAQCWACR